MAASDIHDQTYNLYIYVFLRGATVFRVGYNRWHYYYTTTTTTSARAMERCNIYNVRAGVQQTVLYPTPR